MNLSDDSPETTSVVEDSSQSDPDTSGLDNSMQEFYQLQKQLLIITLAITGIIFFSVWIAYSFNIALNYLLGACTGVVYLRMLARDVERLGNQKERLGNSRLALFIGLIIVATQWNQLQIMPIFLGFLTYKLALLAYVLRTTLMTNPQ